jgi:hypothetical protein
MNLYTTVKQLLLAEGHADLASIIVSENISDVQVDNWNGGIYDIKIKIPVNIYVGWSNSDVIEKKSDIILDAFRATSIDVGYDCYRDVVLYPDSEAKIESSDVAMSEEVTSWERGYFKMFISHLTIDKIYVSQLKVILNSIGISCFVAHEDIEPTKVWQDEIVKALKTANALCALISTKFIESTWCDQEVGFGLGRGILCISLIHGRDPYGILGMTQGLKCNNKDLKTIAIEIFDILCTNDKTREKYTRCIADLLLQSTDKPSASKWLKVVEHMKLDNTTLLEYIRQHFTENKILKDKELINKVDSILHQHSLAPIEIVPAATTINDDDLPF